MATETDKSLKKIKKDFKNGRIIYPSKLEDWIKSNGNTGADITEGSVAFIRFKLSQTKIKQITVDEAKIEAAEKSIKEGKLDYNTEDETYKDDIKSIEPPISEIILPIVPVTDTTSGSWTGVEGLGLLQQGFGKYLSWKFLKGLSGIASTVLPKEIMVAFKNKVLGGGLDNPHEKLMYSGHERRSFDVAYTFMKPESKTDELRLKAIIDTFRVCSVGGYGDLVISPPPTISVDFVSLPIYNNFLRYGRCGLQSCVITYGGEGEQFAAMKSGMPFVTISLTFGELDYVTPNQLMWTDPNITVI